MRLQDKVVWITEADSDTGRGIIARFAREGARFLLNSASGGANIQEELALLDREGSVYVTVNCDLLKRAETEKMLAGAESILGPLGVLIHNNSTVIRASVEHCPEESFWESLDANAKTAFISTQAAGRSMREREQGKIIYLSSIHAEKPTGSAFTYSIAKGAVGMLAKEAALALGRYGISVNTVRIGPFEGDDELFHSDFSTLYNDYRYKVPNAVLGDGDDLAELALYLASDEARYLNGADIAFDGGFLLHYMNFKMKKPKPAP
ncbi:SDR family NAD(P)-dependent oxidoreductase [Paenibacillus sp. CAU 1782]